MTHASVELIEAMRGESPVSGSMLYRFGSEAACRSEASLRVFALVLQPDGLSAHEPSAPVTCPNCLAIMDAARGEQRRNELAVMNDARLEATSR